MDWIFYGNSSKQPGCELRFICSKLKDEENSAKFELRVWEIEVNDLTDEIDREIGLLEDLQRQADFSDDHEQITSEIRDGQNNIRKLSRDLEIAQNELRKWQDQIAIIEFQKDANRCHQF